MELRFRYSGLGVEVRARSKVVQHGWVRVEFGQDLGMKNDRLGKRESWSCSEDARVKSKGWSYIEHTEQ